MIIRFVMSRPKFVAIIWVILFALGGFGAAQLNNAVKAGGFNDQNGQSFKAQEINQDVFGDPENELSVVLKSDNEISTDSVDAAFTAIRELPRVAAVVDSRNVPALSSTSGKTHIIQVGIDADNTTTQNMVPDLREKVAQALEGTGTESHVTGAAALDYDLNMQSQKDALNAEMIAFPLLILVLLIIYRSIGPTIVTLLIAGVSLVGTQGIGTVLTKFLDVSNMYITGASLIGLAVSVDYCLFLIARYKENLHAGKTSQAALISATQTAGHAIRFGGLSVIVALCALFIARNMVFSSIALAGITVTGIALLALATLVPAIITFLGDRLFFGRLPGFSKPTQPNADLTDQKALSVLKAPIAVTLAIAIPLLIATIPLASIKLQVPVASSGILPAGMDSRSGIEAIEDELDPRDLFPTSVTFESKAGESAAALQARADAFAAEARSLPGVSEVVVPKPAEAQAGPLRMTATKSGHNYVRVLLYSTGLPDSQEAHDLVDAVEAKTVDEFGVYITGATAQGNDFDKLVSNSIPWIVSAVLLISLALLGWAFRSWRLPLIAVALNALVVAAAMGTLSFLWRVLTGESINSVTPIVIFAIVFGLSMDYMVLMASRMKEIFADGATHTYAITLGVIKTSRLVISAAVIMIGVFLSFMVAEISIVRELGLGLAFAVGLDALIVRPYLLPSVIALMGPKVWGQRPVTIPDQLEKEPELVGALQ